MAKAGDEIGTVAEIWRYPVQSMCELLLNWLRRFPIVSIEDPLAEDDAASFAGFTAAIGSTVQVVGDDFLVTNAGRIDTAARDGACNAALIKPNQAGTLSEAEAALTAARSAGWGAIVSARSGESEDTTIVHLAVGWGVPQLKVGSISRSERTAKWNEALRMSAAASAPSASTAATPNSMANGAIASSSSACSATPRARPRSRAWRSRTTRAACASTRDRPWRRSAR